VVVIARPLVPLLLLVLLLAQAASSVCTAQCMEQKPGGGNGMTGCSAMARTTANAAAVDCCPVRQSSVCAIQLPANNQDKIAASPLIESEFGEILPALPKSLSLTDAFSFLRGSVGDPPLITPLRV
jgi:hypothetical protein